LKPVAVDQISKPVSQVRQRGLVQLQIRRGSRVGGEKHPEPFHKRLTRRRFAAQVSHHTRHNNLLHTHLHQPLLQPRVLERAVSVLLHHLVLSRETSDLGHEFCLHRAIKNEIVVPPLPKHAVVGGRLVVVASEENRDGGPSAEVYGSKQLR